MNNPFQTDMDIFNEFDDDNLTNDGFGIDNNGIDLHESIFYRNRSQTLLRRSFYAGHN